MRQANGFDETFVVKLAEPKAPGLNDGMIYPSDQFAVGTAPSAIRNAAADRAPLRGTLRVIVVLVDFTDKHMTQNASHFKNLFFSQGVIPTKSVREYYQEVTNGLVDIQGDVVGPFRMPQTLAAYAHGAAGLGNVLPNARTMARDAVIASNPSVNFGPFDNNGDGFVDAFIVIHAGSGGKLPAIQATSGRINGSSMAAQGRSIQQRFLATSRSPRIARSGSAPMSSAICCSVSRIFTTPTERRRASATGA